MTVPQRRRVHIPVSGVGRLSADLIVAEVTAPLVVFADGSGSSRHRARNQAVAQRLTKRRSAPCCWTC